MCRSTSCDGEIFGLIGPNGAGKTTTLECVEGLRTPDSGRIAVLGLDPVRDVYRLQGRIGVQLQEAQLQKRISVWEAVHFWAGLYRRPIADGERLLDRLGLADKRQATFMTLSGGQKQRLFIALALINDPEVVFLDELTTGLDPQARRDDLGTGPRHPRARQDRVSDDAPDGRGGAPLRSRRHHRSRPHRRHRLAGAARPAPLSRAHAWFSGCEDPSAATRFESIPRSRPRAQRGWACTVSGRGDNLITDVIHCLSEHRIRVTDFRTVIPTLEDVFLTLTGHSIRE